jgi:hypothetical protein
MDFFLTDSNIMWECNPGDLKQEEQVQHQRGLGEIQDLSQAKIPNEHSMQACCHAHYQACSKNWCA